MEEQIQYDSGLTFEKVWAMFQESDRKWQETRREMKESQKETERKWQETREKNEREIKEIQKETQKIVSDLGRKFGTIIEYMFIPNLHKNSISSATPLENPQIISLSRIAFIKFLPRLMFSLKMETARWSLTLKPSPITTTFWITSNVWKNYANGRIYMMINGSSMERLRGL
jgi:hypothetical protein